MAARRGFPDAPEPWIDLSTGINAVAFSLPPMPPEVLTRLPEPDEVAALEAVAARAFGVADPACVVAAPGTQALIHLLPRLLPLGRVAVLSPTYAEHAAAWAQAGHAVFETAEAVDADTVVMVRPNNPDGAVADGGAVLRLAARGGLLVVDEAFADLEGCSLAPAMPRPGLLLLRSFGKTYGLAGLRLGFAVADPGLAARLRQALGPWAVSGPAVWAGLLALPDTAWRDAAAARLAGEAARLDDRLGRAGWPRHRRHPAVPSGGAPESRHVGGSARTGRPAGAAVRRTAALAALRPAASGRLGPGGAGSRLNEVTPAAGDGYGGSCCICEETGSVGR